MEFAQMGGSSSALNARLPVNNAAMCIAVTACTDDSLVSR